MGISSRPQDLNALSPQHTRRGVTDSMRVTCLWEKEREETTGFTSRENTREVAPGAELLCLQLFFSSINCLRGSTASCLQPTSFPWPEERLPLLTSHAGLSLIKNPSHSKIWLSGFKLSKEKILHDINPGYVAAWGLHPMFFHDLFISPSALSESPTLDQGDTCRKRTQRSVS